MNRRSFLQTAGKAGVATRLTSNAAQSYIPEHNSEKYDWLTLPQGTDWRRLKLKTELEVNGVRCPVKWACHQKTNRMDL